MAAIPDFDTLGYEEDDGYDGEEGEEGGGAGAGAGAGAAGPLPPSGTLLRPSSSASASAAHAASAAAAGGYCLPEDEPRRACDRRRLLVRHLQAYVGGGMLPSTAQGLQGGLAHDQGPGSRGGGVIDLKLRESSGSYRKVINSVLPAVFGKAFAEGSHHYGAPKVYQVTPR